MLTETGARAIEDFFDEIPASLRVNGFAGIPAGESEMELVNHFARFAQLDEGQLCFAGAGCYDHHIPAAVWDVTTRGEFLTAYTPYQAEASQGTLQLIYEFQTMICGLTAMECANASVYDGGSALAEAILMAVRCQRRHPSRQILVSRALHPYYRDAANTIVHGQEISLHNSKLLEGRMMPGEITQPPVAVVIQQPNFFGVLEEVDDLVDWAHDLGALVIAVVNPLSLGVLKPPGDWGENGADIVVGDGQPLGIPMASGGPSFGFMCTRDKFVRQLPGRIVGSTVDLEGKTGYTLTLQAREQHIRRGKATSNICTNQGLLVTAGTIYMSLMGPQGMRRAAEQCHAKSLQLVEAIESQTRAKRCFDAPFFHECLLDLGRATRPIVNRLLQCGILAGVSLGDFDPKMDNHLLVCVTEKRTEADIDRYVDLIAQELDRAD